MKKVPPFTLIEQPRLSDTPSTPKTRSLAGKAGKLQLAKGILSSLPFDQVFKDALVRTFIGGLGKVASTAKSKARQSGAISSYPSQVSEVLGDLNRGNRVARVGVLDMGAWLGNLPTLLENLNAAQPLFTMFEVHAPMPSGLRKTPEGIAAWIVEQTGEPLGKSEQKALESHVVIDEFVVAAESTRRSLGLDLMVGVTPGLVAGTDDGVYWNHFSFGRKKCILVSIADVRQFAEEADRPFEAGLGVLLIAAILVSLNKNLDYHDEDAPDTGCIFDYNRSRVSLTTTIEKLDLDDACRNRMTPEQLSATVSMIEALKRMKKR